MGTIASRLARLEATTRPGPRYGIGYRDNGRALVYDTATGEALGEDEWRARHPAGVIVKRLVGVSPHDL
jgi:hypothetical protein